MNEDQNAPLTSPNDIQPETRSLKKHLMPTRLVLIITITTIILLLLAFISFSRRMDTDNDSLTITPNPSVTPTPLVQTEPTTSPNESRVTYKSNSRYDSLEISERYKNDSKTYEFFVATLVDNSDNSYMCPVGVLENETNREIQMFPFSKAKCDLGYQGYYIYEKFALGWLNDQEFIIQHSFGELTAYNINGTNRVALSYDPTKFFVEIGNSEGTHWLAREIDPEYPGDFALDRDSTNIFILDSDASVIMSDNLGGGSIALQKYDVVNDGFFLSTTEFGLDTVTYRMYWIDDSTLEKTELASYIQTEIGGGRGCEPGEFSSTLGTITYTGLDCFILPSGVGDDDTLTFILP